MLTVVHVWRCEMEKNRAHLPGYFQVNQWSDTTRTTATAKQTNKQSKKPITKQTTKHINKQEPPAPTKPKAWQRLRLWLHPLLHLQRSRSPQHLPPPGLAVGNHPLGRRNLAPNQLLGWSAGHVGTLKELGVYLKCTPRIVGVEHVGASRNFSGEEAKVFDIL